MVLRNGLRLGIGHVNDVVLVDRNSARPAELLPLRDIVSFLVEDLDPIVIAIPDEQPSFRIEGQAMRYVDLPRPGSLLSPHLDNFPILRELPNAFVAVPAMPVRDKNISIQANCNSGRHIECVRTI